MGSVALNEDQQNYLNSLYTNPNIAGSLGGINAFYKLVKSENQHPEISKNQIREWLKSVPIYTRWRPAFRKHDRNKIQAKYPGQLFQFDIMYTDNEEEIGGVTYKFALLGIDVFSRYAFYAAIPNNKTESVLPAIDGIFSQHDYKPARAMSDPAGEFTNKTTKDYFKEKKILFYTTKSLIHCPHVERLIRTLKTRLRRYAVAYNTKKWVEPLGAIVQSYNATVSKRTHGFSPWEVMYDSDKALLAYQKLYGGKKSNPPKDSKLKDLKAGTYVRVSRIKNPFEKESTEHGNWSREIYRVMFRTRRSPRMPLPMYQLEGLDGEKIKGKFYRKELQPIIYNPGDLYEVEKILGRKRIRGVPHVKVKWKGYSKRRAEWIRADQMQDVAPDQLIRIS